MIDEPHMSTRPQIDKLFINLCTSTEQSCTGCKHIITQPFKLFLAWSNEIGVFLIQVKEDGLPGPLDSVPIPVGVGSEQVPETAPLPVILNVALVTALPLKHVSGGAGVSINIPHLMFMGLLFRVVYHIEM